MARNQLSPGSPYLHNSRLGRVAGAHALTTGPMLAALAPGGSMAGVATMTLNLYHVTLHVHGWSISPTSSTYR